MRAQISGQTIVYIFALIAAAMVLVFGYKGIGFLIEKSREADLRLFETQLKSDVKAGMSYGTEKLDKRYFISSAYRQVCFAQIDEIRREPPVAPVNPDTISANALVKDSLKSGAKKNVFLVPNGEKSFYIENLAVEGKFMCIPTVGGALRLKLVGCGDITFVAPQGSAINTEQCSRL